MLGGLISIETEQRWTVRERPQQRGQEPPKLGSPLNRPEFRLRSATTEEEQRIRRNPLNIDDEWLSCAVRNLENSEALRDALSAFYEGVGLVDDHASFAAVAFVTCVEQIGDLLFGEEDPPIESCII
jgi:hypothetical protein